MQGGRGRGDPFFGSGDPFAGFGFGFGGMPSLFGGRDPFFFTQPMGGMLQPSLFGHAGSPFMGASPFGFGSTLFGPNGSPFMDAHAPRIHEHRQSIPNTSRAPLIEELNSDEEKDEHETGHGRKDNPHKHGRSPRQPYVEQPYEGTEGRELNRTQYGNQFNIMHDTHSHSHPQAHSFSFQSSSVTYGGSNGAYYTSSTTRRAGSDGVRFEEHKEADSVTGEAAHRISRGIHDKGHTLSRHLKSDGHVDTMQTLHNLNEDEVSGFEEAWKGKARKYLPPGWTGGTNTQVGINGSGEPSSRGGGLALPSTENTHAIAGGRRKPGVAERAHAQSSKARRR